MRLLQYLYQRFYIVSIQCFKIVTLLCILHCIDRLLIRLFVYDKIHVCKCITLVSQIQGNG